MPQLIKKIEGSVIEETSNSVGLISSISGELQQEDYINMSGFIAYLQDLTETEYTESIPKPVMFGVKNKYNISIITLNINY